jgi:hypothetical protein
MIWERLLMPLRFSGSTDAGPLFLIRRPASLLTAALLGCGLIVVTHTAKADAKSALPVAVPPFKITKPVQVFSPATLENHIDGQAESVKHYQFTQCDYAEYAPNGQGNQLITVDIYEMGTPLDAYGYYSYQLSPSAKTVTYVKVGAEGYQTKDGLNFWKGNYYVNVTITASNPPPVFAASLPKFGQAIAAKLPGAAQAPAMLKLLPPGYPPHSEKYQRTDVAGQSFLKNAVSASYPAAGTQAELFVAAWPSPTEAKQAYAQYQTYLNKPTNAAAGAKATPIPGLGDSAITVKTKFSGVVVAALKGKYVIGIRKARDLTAAQNLVKAAVAHAQ